MCYFFLRSGPTRPSPPPTSPPSSYFAQWWTAATASIPCQGFKMMLAQVMMRCQIQTTGGNAVIPPHRVSLYLQTPLHPKKGTLEDPFHFSSRTPLPPPSKGSKGGSSTWESSEYSTMYLSLLNHLTFYMFCWINRNLWGQFTSKMMLQCS